LLSVYKSTTKSLELQPPSQSPAILLKTKKTRALSQVFAEASHFHIFTIHPLGKQTQALCTELKKCAYFGWRQMNNCYYYGGGGQSTYYIKRRMDTQIYPRPRLGCYK
jgi:hypothetical protein